MDLTFKTTYDMRAYSRAISYPKLPSEIEVRGHIARGDQNNLIFKASIGDYILLEWVPGGVCTFNKYGRYGTPDRPVTYDNLRAEDLPIDMFRQLVGDSFAPSDVEEV
jgi:hypothetical protein